MDIYKAVEKINKILDENNIWADVWQYMDLPVVQVEISWGDWKHDHARTDYLLKNLGCTLMKEEITENDGSDCYSAIHYFYVREMI